MSKVLYYENSDQRVLIIKTEWEGFIGPSITRIKRIDFDASILVDHANPISGKGDHRDFSEGGPGQPSASAGSATETHVSAMRVAYDLAVIQPPLMQV